MIWSDDFIQHDKNITTIEEAVHILRKLSDEKKKAVYDHQKQWLENDIRNRMKAAIKACLYYT